MRKKKISYYLLVIVGLAGAVIALFPLVWMLIAGFKESTEVLATPFKFFPKKWILDNYQEVFTDSSFFRALLITFVGAVISTFLCLTINSMAAYVFARIDFTGKKFIWVYVILTMFIPGIAILVPTFMVVQKMRILDTMFVLIIPGVTQATHIFFLRQFYLNVPRALEEASFIDGASRLKTYFYIFLPLSKGPFVIVGISAFLGYWNALVWPIMTISNEDLYQIMQLLAYFRSGNLTNWALVMAATSVAALPPILLFVIFQRQIVQGIKIAGLK